MDLVAGKILLVRPAAFGYNPQTAGSNVFQKESPLSREEIGRRARDEFDRVAAGLRRAGIEVVIFDDPAEPHTPDAVFPNNWFSTHPDGTLCLYPLEAPARRLERNPELIEFLQSKYEVSRVVDLSDYENENRFLEGTGSLVLDHKRRIAYAALSSRTDELVLDRWATELGFGVIKFRSFDRRRRLPVYHTNVLMCLGERFAVVCLESITDEREKAAVTKSLRAGGREIIRISAGQMENFAGNMLLLTNGDGEKKLIMSARARNSLTAEQEQKLSEYAGLVSFDIDLIETCGGGSVRCMIAEIFFGDPA